MNNKIPKISVIMPFYNCEKYLDKSISSILEQTFTDFELILINDASTDKSDIVVEKYLNDDRVIYIKNKTNKKIVSNLNLGLSIAKAEIIARMDGDDISEITRFEKQYIYLQNNPEIVLVGSFVRLINENGIEIGTLEKPVGRTFIKKVCFFYGPHVHPSIMFRKDIILNLGGYRTEYQFCEDIDLYFRIIYSGLKTDNLPEFLLKYRIHLDTSDIYFREKALKSFKLKREMIKNFNLHLSFKEKLSMYCHYFLDKFLSIRSKHKLQKHFKSLFYK